MAGHDDLDAVDRDALTRAMQIAIRRDPGRAQQLQSKLQDEPWREVAEFAAYGCQMHALSLRPWRDPPCHADEDETKPRDKAAQRLLRKMLAAGVSRYEPDPLAALERLSARSRRKA